MDDIWPYDDEDDGHSDLASVLDFSAPQHSSAMSDDVASEHADALADALADDRGEQPVFAVSNPPGTVTVTTGLDGRIRKIELASRTGGLTLERPHLHLHHAPDSRAPSATNLRGSHVGRL